MRRRSLLAAGLAVCATTLAPRSLRARCAVPSLASEIAASRYVVEATVVRTDAHAVVLRVIASWKGSPPETLTVSFSGRSQALRRGPAESTLLVFVHGASDAHLSLHPCGASGPLIQTMVEHLTTAGLRRRALG